MEKIFAFKTEVTYYEVLGCVPTSSKEQITTEYRLLAKQYHPDKTFENAEGTEKYEKICEAYKVLCDEIQRKDYDKWMMSGLCLPYKKWRSLSKASHTSLHWGSMKSNQLCVKGKDDLETREEDGPTDGPTDGPILTIKTTTGNKRTSDRLSLRSKFRKYKI